MADRNNPFQKSEQGTGAEFISDAATRVRADVEHMIEGFDLKTITNRIEEFGKQNPVGLALTALTFGVAVGFLMRSSKQEIPSEQFSTNPPPMVL